MQKKTEAEYDAMAMLLGREYDADAHSFFRVTTTGLPDEVNPMDLDADTLEPLDLEEVSKRHAKAIQERGVWNDKKNT